MTMSLANRITCFLLAVLAAVGVLGSLAFYGSVQRSLEAELQGTLDARIVWIEAALELDDDEMKDLYLWSCI